MRIKFTNQLFTIPAGQAFSGIAERPQTLQIAGGKVWITVEGCSQDYWLSAGDRLPLEPGRLVVMEAGTTDSRIAVQAIAEERSPTAIGRQLGERLFAAMRRLHATPPTTIPDTCHCS